MFTKEQTKAIQEVGNIIVSAGAGSGKTLVLSERVLHFIKEKNYKIEEFLILTFTRLAAQEMKERIRKKLLKANLEDAYNIDNADISTFDSFTNSLVKKYHTHLDIDDNFTLIGSNVIEVLKRKILREELSSLYLENNPIFESLLNYTCKKNDDVIFSLVLNVMKIASNQLDKYSFYDQFITKYYQDNLIKEIFNNITSELLVKKEDLLASVNSLPSCIDKKGVSLQEKYLQKFEELSNSYTYESILAAANNFKAPPLTKDLKEQLDEDEITSYDELKKKNDKILKSIKSLKSKEEEKESILATKEYARIIISLAEKVEKRVDSYKYKYQAFEFIDINRFAITLVEKFKDIREEVKSKYKMIMIDEYQDTNDIQEKFISYIQNNNVYCVGDIKQSIYAFRNAKCDIFQNKYELYKNNPNVGTAIDLNSNFRSRKEVLEDINLIFKNIMTLDVGGANYLKEHIIEYGNKKYLNDVCETQNNHLEIYVDETNSSYSEMEIIAQDIVNKINNKYQVCDRNDDNLKLRDCRFEDFAIIIDRGTRFDDYARVLQSYKIPVHIEQDKDLKENSLVLLLKEILIFTLYLKENKPSDKLFKHAFVSIARSFAFSYSDQKIYHIIKNDLIITDPLTILVKGVIDENIGLNDYLLVYKIIEKMNLYLSLVKLGNVKENSIFLDSFLNVFKQMDVIDFTIEDFITYLDSINEFNLKFNVTSLGNSSNAVTIINVHKSKGLEYPITYFGGLDKKFVRMDVKGNVNLSLEYGFYFNELGSIVKRAYVNTYDKELVSEKLRLFYVALTRCREKMIFVTNKLLDPNEYRNEQSQSFNHFLSSNASLFRIRKKQVESFVELKTKVQNVEEKKFKVIDVSYDYSLKETDKKASKDINFNVNKKALDFGNMLHFALEVTSFTNPNYDLISSNYIRGKVKAFIASPLLKDVSNARIFKEYEFVDLEDSTSGIIDLFLVYNDHIDLIDYKTKNIYDESYNIQIGVYARYLQKKYKLKVKAYLYSLIDEKYQEINLNL